MLADAAASGTDYTPEYVYDRHSVRQKRGKTEIGIHSVRGGSIVGEHEVLFAGTNETVTLSHSAASREVFAVGAVRAAIYMKGKGAGLYSMKDVIASMIGE
jgi:4-hydroxy-tetrahydrodipicolinate reductase